MSCLVSIIMPVYNCEKFIFNSISSILNQTFIDFELIIINDFSTDNTESIINEFHDYRIKVIKNSQNYGQAISRNIGIENSSAEIIAFMDADDLAYNLRIKKQYDFLCENLNVDIVGTQYKILGENIIINVPTSHEIIKSALLSYFPFGNPTLMFRKKILENYNLKFKSDFAACEDYDFFSRAILSGAISANLNEVLLEYRVHKNQISFKRKDEEISNTVRIKHNILKHLYNDLSISFLDLSYNFDSIYEIKKKYYLFKKDIKILYRSNNNSLVFNKEYFNEYLNKQLFNSQINILNSTILNNKLSPLLLIFKMPYFCFDLGFSRFIKFSIKKLLYNKVWFQL